MQRESIEDLIARVEFKPFKIITTAGLGYDISNPHNIALGQTEFCYFSPKSDRFVFVPYDHIATVEGVEIKSGPSRKR